MPEPPQQFQATAAQPATASAVSVCSHEPKRRSKTRLPDGSSATSGNTPAIAAISITFRTQWSGDEHEHPQAHAAQGDRGARLLHPGGRVGLIVQRMIAGRQHQNPHSSGAETLRVRGRRRAPQSREAHPAFGERPAGRQVGPEDRADRPAGARGYRVGPAVGEAIGHLGGGQPVRIGLQDPRGHALHMDMLWTHRGGRTPGHPDG